MCGYINFRIVGIDAGFSGAAFSGENSTAAAGLHFGVVGDGTAIAKSFSAGKTTGGDGAASHPQGEITFLGSGIPN